MPRGKQAAKAMACKRCGVVIHGKPHDMARHARLDCPGKPGDPSTRKGDSGVDLDDLVGLVDNLDADQITNEINRLDRRRAALVILQDAARARHKPAGS